jgi:RsmE family RNA methyltransferase
LNIILFSPGEVQLPLPRQDARARHILAVLRRKPGDSFDAGLLNGPLGKATLLRVDDTTLELSFTWGAPPPPLAPIGLIVGLPRPQTARDVLRESASLGVSTLDFVSTNRSEAGYAQSSLWTSGEAARLLVAGAAQAFCTRVPELRHGRTLAATIGLLPASGARIALDNYDAAAPLSSLPRPATPVTLALGAERGWTDDERELLRAQGFVFAHLGPRVLRTETACIAAVTLLKAKLGLA